MVIINTVYTGKKYSFYNELLKNVLNKLVLFKIVMLDLLFICYHLIFIIFYILYYYLFISI